MSETKVSSGSVFDHLPQIRTVIKVTLVVLLLSALAMIPVSHLILHSATLLYVSSSIAVADLLICSGWILKSLCRTRDRSVISKGEGTLTPSPSALSIQNYSQEETKKRIFLAKSLSQKRMTYEKLIPSSSKFKNIFVSELTSQSSFRIFEGDGSLLYPIAYGDTPIKQKACLEKGVSQLLILVPACESTERQRVGQMRNITDRCYKSDHKDFLNPNDLILFLSYNDKIQLSKKLSWLQKLIKTGRVGKKFTPDGKFECAKVGINSFLYKQP